MKNLHPSSLLLFLALATSLPLWAAAPENDIREIPLVATVGYDPRLEHGRHFNAFFSSIGIFFAGPGTNLTKAISEKLDQEALRPYFPDPRERSRLAQRVADETKRRHLSNGYNNRSVLAALRYATNELIGTIAKRVLEKEGLKDPARAALWSAKVLAPFNRCMDNARSYTEGTKCAEPLETDLTKNMGLAMAFELSRQEFGTSYAKARPAEYLRCLEANRPGAEQRVKECATRSVRKAASDFGRARVLAVARKTMPAASAEKVVNRVMKEFDSCLAAASERGGFVRCGDSLIGKAGAEIASETIRLDARVNSYFPAAEDRERVATAGRDAFVRCMNENQKANRRDAQGTLMTENCELFVRMETGRTVALEVFRRTLEQNMKSAPAAERQKLFKNVSDQLARCWDSKKPEEANAVCLRETAKQAALAVASERLGRELPPETDAAFKTKLLDNFGACIEQKLPTNLISSSSSDIGIEVCAAQIFREASLKVAEAKVRKALEGKVTDTSVVEEIINTSVKVDFPECLGEKPDEALLASCSLKLQKNVAWKASLALVPGRIDDFLNLNGGMLAYGLDETKKKALVDQVLSAQKLCLKKEVKSTNPAKSELEITSCFKNTIRDIALRLAPLDLARSARESGVTVSPELEVEFKNDFAGCLDGKKDPKFSLDDYLSGLESCQAEITKIYTVKIAKAELKTAISQVLSDPSTAPQAEALQKKLFADFDKCVAEARDGSARDVCISDLRGAASVELSRFGVRTRALKALETTELPPFVNELEKALDHCVAEKALPKEECALNHVKSATIRLGAYVLRTKLGETFPATKVAKLEPEIKKLEEPFVTCVNNSKGPLGQAFLDQLEDCGNKLSESAVDFVMTHLADPAINPVPGEQAPASPPADDKSAALSAHQLSEMLTRAFLCLSGNLTPENEESLSNLKPGGVEAELLKMIGAYVNYDLQAAQGQAGPVIQQLAEDLKIAGSQEARKNLLDQLVKKGMVDQLLKSIARSEIERAVGSMQPSRNLSPELQKKLLDKNLMNKALDEATMAKLRPVLANGVLKPIIVDGRGLSIMVLVSYTSARSQTIEALLRLPEIAPDEATRQQIRNALK